MNKNQLINNILEAYYEIKKLVRRSKRYPIGNSIVDHQHHLDYEWFTALTLIRENKSSFSKTVKEAEKIMRRLKCKPAVIIGPLTTPSNAAGLLKKMKYSFKEGDIWLLWPPKDKVRIKNNKLKAKPVSSSEDASKYVHDIHDKVFAEWGESNLD